MLLKKQLLNYQQLFLSYFIHSNKKYIQLNNDLTERWQIFLKSTEFVTSKKHKHVAI